MSAHPILAVIPARGGSKGLPGKNVRDLAGLPLIVHSILAAKLCPEISRTIVTTDSEKIAEVARTHGGDVPFLRPPELATDDTPMWPVLQHALREMERSEGRRYGSLLLLDPTSPCRLPSDITRAVELLEAEAGADGVIGMSQPDFSPYWHCMVPREGGLEGYMRPLFPEAPRYSRRQDLPPVLCVNGLLYLWRRDFIEDPGGPWMEGRLLGLEIPRQRAVNIDEPFELDEANALIRGGVIELPWLEKR